ncbi:hypothetical protein TNCV_108391 [Trichonephila clavipes]|nr:hypothetical protein TNCV_108391 [Trichonephila clavipes]
MYDPPTGVHHEHSQTADRTKFTLIPTITLSANYAYTLSSWITEILGSIRSGETKKKGGERKKRKRKRSKNGSVFFGKRRKEDLGVLDRDADQESLTRIKNALRTVSRQALEK